MAASRIKPLVDVDMLAMLGGKPVAWMYGLPLSARQATAYMAVSADHYTDDELATLQAWIVEMTLKNGTWVSERLAFVLALQGGKPAS